MTDLVKTYYCNMCNNFRTQDIHELYFHVWMKHPKETANALEMPVDGREFDPNYTVDVN